MSFGPEQPPSRPHNALQQPNRRKKEPVLPQRHDSFREPPPKTVSALHSSSTTQTKIQQKPAHPGRPELQYFQNESWRNTHNLARSQPHHRDRNCSCKERHHRKRWLNSQSQHHCSHRICTILGSSSLQLGQSKSHLNRCLHWLGQWSPSAPVNSRAPRPLGSLRTATIGNCYLDTIINTAFNMLPRRRVLKA